MTILEEQLEASVRNEQAKANRRAITLVRAPQNEIVTYAPQPLAFTPEQRQMIREHYAAGASEAEFEVLLEICKVRRLNPLLRQVHLVRRYDKDKDRYVWAVQISIDGLRAIAERTGLYNGQDEAEFGPKNEAGFPEFAKVRVYRKGWDRPAVGVAYWAEYVQTTKQGQPTRFWRDMPHNQIAKCAEAAALRKAFPEDCGGLYTDIEMEQAMNSRPANDRELHGEVVERRPIPAHDVSIPAAPEANGGFVVFEGLLSELQTIENSIAGCKDYDGALILREILGCVAFPSTLTREIQLATERRSISGAQYAILGKKWKHCDYELKKLEKNLAPGVVDSFRD